MNLEDTQKLPVLTSARSRREQHKMHLEAWSASIDKRLSALALERHQQEAATREFKRLWLSDAPFEELTY